MEIPITLKQVLEPELIADIKNNAQVIHIKAGETILEIGQTVRVIPLILKGSVKVSRENDEGQELLLYYINSNETCAMTFTCCMMQHASEVHAVAEDDVELLAIPIKFMDEWMTKYPSWKSFVMRTIRQRFNELLKTIDNIAFKKLDTRLVDYLKEKSTTSGSALVNLTHQQIADDLGTSRVVVSRLLKQLENQKKVLLFRHQLKLLKEF